MNDVRADMARLELSPSAFFFADLVSVAVHHAAYSEFHNWSTSVLSEATNEFQRMASAPGRAAEMYDTSDGRTVGSMSSIFNMQNLQGT
jgi:hypothetical protein